MTQALCSARSFAFVPVGGRSIRDLLIRLSSRFASEVVTPSGKEALSRDALLQQRFVLEFSCDLCYLIGCQCFNSLWYDMTPPGVEIGSNARHMPGENGGVDHRPHGIARGQRVRTRRRTGDRNLIQG